MGKQMHQDFIHLISEDATYNARVEAILGRMRPYLSKQDFDHNIFVLEDSEFTAFTIPGGNIYLSIGLIEALPGDDELGFIIGHELGHSENSHTAELARLIKDVEIAEEEGDLFTQIVATLTKYQSLVCNKADELEADIAAVYLLHAAGYDPERAFLATSLLRQMDDGKPSNAIEHWIYSLARIHPWSEDRDRCVRQYVKNAKAVAQCRNKYEKRTRAKVATQRSPLNVRQYPSTRSQTLGQFERGEEITLICDCVKQQSGMQFVFARNNDGLKGWVDKEYVQLIGGK